MKHPQQQQSSVFEFLSWLILYMECCCWSLLHYGNTININQTLLFPSKGYFIHRLY